MTAAVLSSTPTPPPVMALEQENSQQAAILKSAIAVPLGGVDVERTIPVQIPNKHLASPNPNGIMKFTCPATPPASPPDGSLVMEVNKCMESLLYPPNKYENLSSSPPIYGIDAPDLAKAMNFTSRQPMPEIDQLFPWAHGLHPENLLQMSFFYARKKAMRRTPTCYRGICIVKVGRDTQKSRLKGAITPEEILPPNLQTPGFLIVDPREGFSVRNFQIQVGKFAGLSDIVVYGDDDTDTAEVMRVAERISNAQQHYRSQCPTGGSAQEFPKYSTFVVQCAFSVFEGLFPEIVTVDSRGALTGKVIDFCHWERMEMGTMSRATEISHNVWLGSSNDLRYTPALRQIRWNVVIEASDMAPLPTQYVLGDLLEAVDRSPPYKQVYLAFPGSGTIGTSTLSNRDIEAVIKMCQWIHAVANGEYIEVERIDEDGDYCMSGATREPKKIIIYCTDGYTETSLLALAYIMFAELLPVHEAWIKLHKGKRRNFFAYDKDLIFLRTAESAILEAGIENKGETKEMQAINVAPPNWLNQIDGSLPSRILPYMYLGNLLHANNYGLLNVLGIKRVLSIGEEVSWTEKELDEFGKNKVMSIKDLQDNGCDPLEYQFRCCLDFIDEGHRLNEPILVHCRVGVSRSATICIAEVMRSKMLSLPRAYCFVRARRLNVIIQPHLRFMYELLKFEESLATQNSGSPKRELEWMHIAREVAAMNRPYTR